MASLHEEEEFPEWQRTMSSVRLFLLVDAMLITSIYRSTYMFWNS
jgi:hypothetical protein